MSVESTTTIAGLNALWPQGTDVKAEGDDHIRLIKSVLKAEFPTGSAGTVVATAQARNRVVNGAMQISQENGNTAVLAAGGFPADQWGNVFSHGVCYGQRVTGVTPNGSKYRLVCGVNTANAAPTYWFATQGIEQIRVADFRWGTASARQVILRFGFQASVAGTYSISLRNGSTTRTYAQAFTITAGQINTETVQTFVIPGDTTGDWPSTADNAAGLYLSIGFGAVGAQIAPTSGWQAGNYLFAPGQTNGQATVGNQFHIFDVGLYLDPLATGKAPAWVMPDDAEELSACMRYWHKVDLLWNGSTTAGSTAYAENQFRVPMRSVPATSAVSSGASGFPAVSGAVQLRATTVITQRTASVTGPGNLFEDIVTLNARM